MQQDRLLITDTSMRDAQQSLLATRMRTVDMTLIAPAYATACKDFFSLEMWGGATFDTAYRFLKESPWARLDELREAIPNVLFQMLLRGANAVGYANYPDNVIRQFVQESAKSGIDVFRIFDSLNWVEAMKVSIDEALKTDKLVEGCICYTGDIMEPYQVRPRILHPQSQRARRPRLPHARHQGHERSLKANGSNRAHQRLEERAQHPNPSAHPRFHR